MKWVKKQQQERTEFDKLMERYYQIQMTTVKNLELIRTILIKKGLIKNSLDANSMDLI